MENNFSLKDVKDLIEKCKEINKNISKEPRFFASEFCADYVQYRFPRSKKKRIKNKWYKREENWKTVPWKYFIHMEMDNSYYGHPSLLAELGVEKMKKENTPHSIFKQIFK
jgi:hypothetical protein